VSQVRLTDFTVKNLPHPERGQVTVWDDGSPLGVRTSQGGTKTFVVILGSGRRHTIGTYGIVTLSQARAAAIRLRAQKTLGRIFPASVSLSTARQEYLEQIDVRDSTRAYYVRNLSRLKAAKLSDITALDINRALSGLNKTSANQALASLRAFFKWCVRPPQSYLAHSPLEGLKVSNSKRRTRVLQDEELRKVWKAAGEQAYPYGIIVQLLILTGQRRGEIANLRRSWINERDATITLPDWATKNGKQHKFPYGNMVAALFDTIPRSNTTDLLFPSRASDDHPLSGWSKYKREMADGVAGWRLHDLRRTFRTTHAALGTPPHIGERLINHIAAITTDVEQIYDVYTYMPEMRRAVGAYEAHLEVLFTG
jgi:integrase